MSLISFVSSFLHYPSTFAKLFNNEFTLDNLSRMHLVNMCKFAGLTPFGTDVILREQLRAHLRTTKEDDVLIRAEGIEALSPSELRDACRSRGMRAAYGSESVAYMRQQLKGWIDLSLNRNLPSSLLLLSRAFIFTHPTQTQSAGAMGGKGVGVGDDMGPDAMASSDPVMDAVKETLGTLPDEVMDDVESFLEEEGRDPLEKKLEYIKHQEEIIAEEAEQMREEEASREEQVAATKQARASGLSARGEPLSPDALATQKAQQVKKVAAALAVLASASSLHEERAAFVRIVDKGIKDYQTRIAGENAPPHPTPHHTTPHHARSPDGGASAYHEPQSPTNSNTSPCFPTRTCVLAHAHAHAHAHAYAHAHTPPPSCPPSSPLAEKAGSQLLFAHGRLVEARPAEEPEDPDESTASILRKRVSKMLHELDRELDDVEAKVKTTLKLMDKDDDGVVR